MEKLIPPLKIKIPDAVDYFSPGSIDVNHNRYIQMLTVFCIPKPFLVAFYSNIQITNIWIMIKCDVNYPNFFFVH